MNTPSKTSGISSKLQTEDSCKIKSSLSPFILHLSFLHTLQKNHYYTYSRYFDSLEELGFEQSKLVTDAGNANYRIEIVEANERGGVATATAVVDFNGNGTYNVWGKIA